MGRIGTRENHVPTMVVTWRQLPYGQENWQQHLAEGMDPQRPLCEELDAPSFQMVQPAFLPAVRTIVFAVKTGSVSLSIPGWPYYIDHASSPCLLSAEIKTMHHNLAGFMLLCVGREM